MSSAGFTLIKSDLLSLNRMIIQTPGLFVKKNHADISCFLAEEGENVKEAVNILMLAILRDHVIITVRIGYIHRTK